MVETILHVGLHLLCLKEIKKIYSLVTKSAKQSSIFAARTSFVLVLGHVLLVLYRIVLVLCRVALVLCRVISCCTRVISCCTRVVLCCVVSCCYSYSFLD